MSRVFATFTSGQHAQQAATTGAAVSFAPPTGPDAVAAFIQAVTNDAIVTFDGSAPSSSNGLVLKQGTNPLFIPCGTNTIKAIGSGGTSTVNVYWLL